MFGTLLSNKLLDRRIADGSISITPYFKELAQTAHYPLTPAAVHRRIGRQWERDRSFAGDGSSFTLEASEYVLVEVEQQIRMKPGFVGAFIPASNLIEEGLGLVAGKISNPFGSNGERVRFGLKNFLNTPNEVKSANGLAYVQFFDLTGLPISAYEMTRRDLDVFSKRRARADDDSVYSVSEDERLAEK